MCSGSRLHFSTPRGAVVLNRSWLHTILLSRPVMGLLSTTLVGASQVTVGRLDHAVHLATRGKKGHQVLKLGKFHRTLVDPIAMANLPRDVAGSLLLRVTDLDELLSAQSLDQVSDHETPKKSWWTHRLAVRAGRQWRLRDVQGQLLVDALTEVLQHSRSDQQGFWHKQHAQNLDSHHWNFWIRGSYELFEFPSTQRLGFLEDGASTSLPKHRAK